MMMCCNTTRVLGCLGKMNSKQDILNDSTIIYFPFPKPAFKKGSPLGRKGRQRQKSKNMLKTYYESPLKHIQKSVLRRDLVNIKNKIKQKVKQPRKGPRPILPNLDFLQDSVIILSDNETDTSETESSNGFKNGEHKREQSPNNNNETRKQAVSMDSSCYIISDDESSKIYIDTTGDYEDPLPQTSKQDIPNSQDGEDIMVVWHSGKDLAKKQKSSQVDEKRLPRKVGKKKKHRNRFLKASQRKGNSSESNEGKDKPNKKGPSKKNATNRNERNDESASKENNRDNENTSRNNPTEKEPETTQRCNATTVTNSKREMPEESDDKRAGKRARTDLETVNEPAEDTLPDAPGFHCSNSQSSTKDGQRFVTYTRIDHHDECANTLASQQRTIHRLGDLREIVIDGNNIGMLYTNHRTFSEKGVELLTNHFINRGHKVKVFVPQYRRARNNPKLEEMYKDGVVVFTPSRRIAGRRITPYDDRYILEYATVCGGVVVSTDQYRDLYSERPDWRETIEKRLLMPTFVGDYIMLPEDPLGQGGPKLYDFLRH